MAEPILIPDGVQSVDARAFSVEKITPPEPLPHVSRRALGLVRGYLPVPASCPYCRSAVSLVSNSVIYGRQYGRWPFAYLCRSCGAYVGLHPDTDLPLGTMADAQLREARKSSKAVFHHLLTVSGTNRKTGYIRLAEMLQIDSSVCHFGMFDLDRCDQARAACQAVLDNHFPGK